jgi:hypothetical protein
VLGWEGSSGYAFHVHGQEFNSFRRQTRSTTLRDFRLHRQETFQYTLGAMDQWAWELRVVDRQPGASGDDTPVRGWAGRGATPVLWRPHRLSADGETAGTGRHVVSTGRDRKPSSACWRRPILIGQPAPGNYCGGRSTKDARALIGRLEQQGPLAPERFSLREANERLDQRLKFRRFA